MEGVSGSAAIREVMGDDPDKSNEDVIAEVRRKYELDVQPASVNNERSKLRKRLGLATGKRGRPAGTSTKTSGKATSTPTVKPTPAGTVVPELAQPEPTTAELLEIQRVAKDNGGYGDFLESAKLFQDLFSKYGAGKIQTAVEFCQKFEASLAPEKKSK